HFFIFADFFFENHLARLVFDNAVERTDGNAAHNVAGTEKTKRFTHYLVNDERLVCKSEKVLFRGHELLVNFLLNFRVSSKMPEEIIQYTSGCIGACKIQDIKSELGL